MHICLECPSTHFLSSTNTMYYILSKRNRLGNIYNKCLGTFPTSVYLINVYAVVKLTCTIHPIVLNVLLIFI